MRKNNRSLFYNQNNADQHNAAITVNDVTSDKYKALHDELYKNAVEKMKQELLSDYINKEEYSVNITEQINQKSLLEPSTAIVTIIKKNIVPRLSFDYLYEANPTGYDSNGSYLCGGDVDGYKFFKFEFEPNSSTPYYFFIRTKAASINDSSQIITGNTIYFSTNGRTSTPDKTSYDISVMYNDGTLNMPEMSLRSYNTVSLLCGGAGCLYCGNNDWDKSISAQRLFIYEDGGKLYYQAFNN